MTARVHSTQVAATLLMAAMTAAVFGLAPGLYALTGATLYTEALVFGIWLATALVYALQVTDSDEYLWRRSGWTVTIGRGAR